MTRCQNGVIIILALWLSIHEMNIQITKDFSGKFFTDDIWKNGKEIFITWAYETAF